MGVHRRIYPRRLEPIIVISDGTIQHVINTTVNTLFNYAQEALVDRMACGGQQYGGGESYQLHAVIQTLDGITLPYRLVSIFNQGPSIDGYFMDSWPAWGHLVRVVE